MKQNPYGAPNHGAEECPTDQTHISVVTDEVLTVGLKSWSRGQKSQAASAMCSGGVSAVMGS